MKPRSRPRTSEDLDFVPIPSTTDSNRVSKNVDVYSTLCKNEVMAYTIFPEVLTDTIQTELRDLQATLTNVCKTTLQRTNLIKVTSLPEKAGTKLLVTPSDLKSASALVTEMETLDNGGQYFALKIRVAGLLQVVRLGNNVNLDPNSYLSLIFLAKTRPQIFRQELVWKAVLSFLGPSRYKRGCVEVMVPLYQPLTSFSEFGMSFALRWMARQ